ncbi:GH18026 [Drosophila grimshawi]|uniref:GH18026 n=1 Tax=Drosophila grimshawi TaxID=7222 RepID=B4JHS6_DROGR|nr:GH18026 [Drosophila grimshawi]
MRRKTDDVRWTAGSQSIVSSSLGDGSGVRESVSPSDSDSVRGRGIADVDTSPAVGSIAAQDSATPCTTNLCRLDCYHFGYHFRHMIASFGS